MTRQLLILCHANVVRSAAAELLANDLVGRAREWSVLSAGTNALRGRPIDPDIGDALRRRTVAVSGHIARQATVTDIRWADLILTFERVQREWVLRLDPTASRKTYTIRRAAELLRSGGFTALLRDGDDRAYVAADDFADPHGKGPAAAEGAVAEIDDLLRVVLPAIGATDRLPPKGELMLTRRSVVRV